MSLWPVEDNATNALMQLFYQYLLQGERQGAGSCVSRNAISCSKPHQLIASIFLGLIPSRW